MKQRGEAQKNQMLGVAVRHSSARWRWSRWGSQQRLNTTKPGYHGNAHSPLPWPNILQLQILKATQALCRPQTHETTLELTTYCTETAIWQCKVVWYLCLSYPQSHMTLSNQTNGQNYYLSKEDTQALTSPKREYLSICKMSNTNNKWTLAACTKHYGECFQMFILCLSIEFYWALDSKNSFIICFKQIIKLVWMELFLWSWSWVFLWLLSSFFCFFWLRRLSVLSGPADDKGRTTFTLGVLPSDNSRLSTPDLRFHLVQDFFRTSAGLHWTIAMLICT